MRSNYRTHGRRSDRTQRTTKRDVLRSVALLVILTIVTIGGCAGAPDYATEEIFDHRGKRRFEEPATSLEIDATTARAILSSPYIPGISIGGIVSGDEESISLYVTDARLFGNWPNGWTEGMYEASGVFVFTRDEGSGGWRVHVQDRFELWGIESGEIRYYDDYFLAEEGTSKVRTRVDRLQAYAQWYAEIGAPFYGDARREGAYGAALRPEFERALATAIGLDADRAGSRDRAAPPPLPEPIARLAESDTIERDLREAPSLFTALYNLTYYTDRVLEGAVLYPRED